MSKKLKLSPWHDGSVKPVNVGVYEISRDDSSLDDGTMFSYFDGLEWHGWVWPREFFKGHIPKKEYFYIAGQDRMWRGVLK